MTPEAQQIAIAEACGYEIGDLSSIKSRPSLAIVGKDGKHWNPHEYSKVPDYLNDLNAMHEAEKVLTFEQMSHYAGHLSAVCYEDAASPMVHATAAQRAEAFLRTLNLWKDQNDRRTLPRN